MAREGETTELERALYSVDEDVICGMLIKYRGTNLHSSYFKLNVVARGSLWLPTPISAQCRVRAFDKLQASYCESESEK